VSKERTTELRVTTDAREPVISPVGRLPDGIRAEVGELSALDVAPDLFHRIELVSVGRQSFRDQPVALALDERGHLLAAVRGESVPDHRGLFPVD